MMLLLLGGASWAQTIYTADNNPGAIGGVNIFTDSVTALQDAIAAASAGDIIHVTRSAVNYGDIIIDKQLSIFGIGLNADVDASVQSRVNIIDVTDPLASGTRISGVWVLTVINLGGNAGTLSNLLIENGFIRRIQHTTATTILTSLIIRNNVIGSSLTTAEEEIDLLGGAISNVVIANNIIYTTGTSNEGVITASNGTIVENNLFYGNANGFFYAFENFSGNSVKNNMFMGLRPHGIGSFSSNTFENNISFDNGGNDIFSTSSGNLSINNIESQNPLFTNANTQGAFMDFSTFDATLQAGSPAIGTGEGGTDMGIFGGASPMNFEGTLIPTIQTITVPTMVVKGDSLAVQIKAKGN
jgi:hypothetical protein